MINFKIIPYLCLVGTAEKYLKKICEKYKNTQSINSSNFICSESGNLPKWANNPLHYLRMNDYDRV